jgi:hypothetical protein
MQGVDARLQASHEQLSTSYQSVGEQLTSFQQMFKEERDERQRSQDCKAQEFAAIDERLQAAFKEEQRSLRDVEGKVLRSFDERARQMREDVMRQDSHATAEAEVAIRRYIDVDIPKLYESLREETRSRESMEDRIVKRASEEINRLQEGVISEKKAREDTEAAVLRVMEDTVAKMRAEIAQERADREATEETLLKLLESTCNKLHVASQTL